MEARPPRVLILDDDNRVNAAFRDCPGLTNYQLTFADSLETGRQRLAREAFDLLLLELDQPDGDGLSLLAELPRDTRIPVFVVSSRNDENSRLKALECGADDFISKPFNARELDLRLGNFFRRCQPQALGMHKVSERIQIGNGLFLKDEYRIQGPDRRSETLTRAERDLLLALADPPGGIRSRRSLAERAIKSTDAISEETITVLVYRIRKKLSAAGIQGASIETVSGAGYRLSVPDGN